MCDCLGSILKKWCSLCSVTVTSCLGWSSCFCLGLSKAQYRLQYNARNVVHQQPKMLLGAYLQQAQLLFHHPRPLA